MSQQVPLTSKKPSKKHLSHEDHHLYELIITNKLNTVLGLNIVEKCHA